MVFELRTTRIDDPDDPRVLAYRSIRERDLVGRQGLFVAEGKVVLDVLLGATGFDISSILILENRLAGMSDILQHAAPTTPVYVADAAVMDAIAGFHIHRGILAIGRRRTAMDAAQLIESLPRNALVVIVVGIANHDNLGAIFRNASAFGANAILLDPTCCDPLYRKAIRVSTGSVFRTPFASFESLDQIMAKLAVADIDMIALSPGGRIDLATLPPARRVALFLGTEGEGLPENVLSRLETVRIAMTPGFDSLNVATACAIALHRLSTGRDAAAG